MGVEQLVSSLLEARENGAVFLYLILVNAASFALMYMDNRRWTKKGERLSDSLLLLPAALGGWPGTVAGLIAYSGRLRHAPFVALLLVLIAMNIIIYQLATRCVGLP